MMKKVITIIALALFMGSATAQDIDEKNIKIGDITLAGYELTLDKEARLTQDALLARLKEADLKAKKDGDNIVVRDQLFAEVSADPITLYAVVKKDGKERCTVALCATPTDPAIDAKKVKDGVRRFLQNFPPYVTRYEAARNAENEEAVLKKALKKQAAAVAAVEKIEKSIKNDQDKIIDKKKDIEKYQEKIKECQKDIKDLEANIAKSQDKKAEAQKEVEAENKNVKTVEGQVEFFRSMAR